MVERKVCSATIGLETKEILLLRKLKTKALISLHGSAAYLRICFPHMQISGFYHDAVRIMMPRFLFINH